MESASVAKKHNANQIDESEDAFSQAIHSTIFTSPWASLSAFGFLLLQMGGNRKMIFSNYLREIDEGCRFYSCFNQTPYNLFITHILH